MRLLVGLLNCEGSLILTHSGSGLVRRKTVIGINIATSASRSIGNLRWLLDRESVAVGGIQEAIFEEKIFRIFSTKKSSFILAGTSKKDYIWISY